MSFSSTRTAKPSLPCAIRTAFRQAVRDSGMKPAIGSKPERPRKLPKSHTFYAKRYLVGCFFIS
jgi:hypothetical protein